MPQDEPIINPQKYSTLQKVKIMHFTFAATQPIKESATEIRGFFATRFNEYYLLHQHKLDQLIYKYPLIQYKIINGKPMVLGINEGAELLKNIYDKYDEITLGQSVYEIVEKGVMIKTENFGAVSDVYGYEFITPWLALNQENYLHFYELKNNFERNNFLKKIFVGNILSIAKSLNYTVPSKLECELNVKIRKGRLKGISMMTFIGRVFVNFLLPDYFGIGKSVSRGFGTIKQLHPTKIDKEIENATSN